MDLSVRSITEAEVPAFRAQIASGFGEECRDEDAPRFREVFELPRLIAAFDRKDLIGTCGAFSFDVTVPGGTLPMGGTTIVTVRSTHRRRGVLTAMMRAHLDEVGERGEPLAGLWASETPIYGRYGYGLAVTGYRATMDGKKLGFRGPAPAGECRLLDKEEAAESLEAVFDRVRGDRPGMFTRTESWWRRRIFDDPERFRGGASSRRYVIHEGPDGVDGYAIYRQKSQWVDFPDGEVGVQELMAATPDAHEALWRHLTRIDLFPNVRWWNMPVDDPIAWKVTDHRRVRCSVWDSLWLRLMDIPRALAGRAYEGSGKLVLRVTDPFLPRNDGRYELEAAPGGGHCRPTNASPDLELGVDALGAVYFGAHRPSALAAAGLVRGGADTLATADRMFAWPVAPWCHEVF